MKNNLKANVALGLSFLGVLFSYPFHNSFTGGLIVSGFSAGLIGGMADWFAINSFFRRPLGIPPGRLLRTEIIPRNREKIIAVLVNMVQKELLSPKAIHQQIENYNFADLLLNYYQKQGGKDELHKLVCELGGSLSKNMPPTEIAEVINRFLSDAVAKQDLGKALEHILTVTRKFGYDMLLAGFIGKELRHIIAQPQVKILLAQLIEGALTNYEKHNALRKIFIVFVRQALTPEKLQTGIIDYLQDDVICRHMNGWLDKLKENVNQPVLREKLDGLWQDCSNGTADLIESVVYSRLIKFLPELTQNNSTLLTEMDRYAERLSTQPDQMIKLNIWLKSKLFGWVNAVHTKTGNLIREALESYSNEQIIELIESKAGNDLQMIRINGSIVGSLVGICLYLLSAVTGS